jgi:predicted anti-sigma-YlaC factor YlaD
MRTQRIAPDDCAQARQQLSLHLDSELSEFEHVLLDAHLDHCADCRAFGQSLAAFTTVLRAVPAERPSIPFQAPRRHSLMGGVRAHSLRVASAAAAIAVVVASGVFALQGQGPRAATPDLRNVRAILALHERRLQQVDAFRETRRRKAVPRGLAAAEKAVPTAVVGNTARIALTPHTDQSQGRR